VKRIFGANNYTIVDHVDRLPEKLPALFASLTRWPQQIVVATGAR
jgi:nitric oxide reductase activation protein